MHSKSSSKTDYTKAHEAYSHIHFALNCPINKNTYYSLLKLLEQLYTIPEDLLVFNFMQKEKIDYHREIRSQILEKMIQCHIEAVAHFYPSNEDSGLNGYSWKRFNEI